MNSTYHLIDSGNFKKLEQVGHYRIVRPAPGAVWSPQRQQKEWQNIDAEFFRNETGKGRWKTYKELPKSWQITIGSLTLVIELTDFGHLGLFAEHSHHWQELEEWCRRRGEKRSNEDECGERQWSEVGLGERQKSREENGINYREGVRVLNLFAYTGGSTLACAKGGATVTHVDASKTSVSWARNNAEASGLKEHSIRWIVDDVSSFVQREERRGNSYHGIILDPPSFGRGSKAQLWKIEDHLIPLLNNLNKILVPKSNFVLLSSHSPGYTPTSLKNLLAEAFGPADFSPSEMFIFEEGGRALPSGACCFRFS